MLDVVKKNLNIWLWGICGSGIGILIWLFGLDGLFQTILAAGAAGAALRAFVFVEKIKKREYSAKASNSDFVLIIQVNRPVVEAMKQKLGNHIQADAIIDAETMFGSKELSVPQMAEMVRAAYRAIAPNQHCTIRLFLQGPQYIGVELGRLTGISFNMVTYTYNTASGQYDAGEPANRTWQF